jgi:fibro-slime domain-containing protein
MVNAHRLGKVSAALSLALCAGFWAAPALAQAAAVNTDTYAGLPDSLSLTGVVRDFKDRAASGGHPDFQSPPSAGFGHYEGMVADALDSDGKPVFASTGYKVNSNWTNAAGQNIIKPKSYINAKSGDRNGSLASSLGGALNSADQFSKWFRDVPGVNSSKPCTIVLKRQSGTNIYTFDDKTDDLYKTRGGFFPINGELFGNYSSTNKNFHFTFELETEFIYEKGAGQVFTFTGDDDVWVFVDGKLVIDLGGIHSAVNQSIELDRLNWLTDGQTYKLKFFFAERHTTQSNFRINTTMRLRSVEPPATSGQYD